MNQPRFKITVEEEKDNFGRFIIEPLAPGFSHTLGTPLRRVLLASLKGAAVTAVKIGGVKHQFSTLPGMQEDIVELILNIKKLRLKYRGEEGTKMHLSFKSRGDVLAKDIDTGGEVTIVNPDLKLATLTTPKAKLEIDFWVNEGYGYSPFEDRKIEELGVIAIDATFTPVTRVNYRVESTRVGRMTDLDKLILEIHTDATIKPSEALSEAAQILTAYFQQIHSPQDDEVVEVAKTKPVSDEVMKMSIEELDLPTRIINALRNGGIETVGDLITYDAKQLAKIKNLGTKSLTIVEEKIKEKNVSLKKG
ncbi:DNA-directed RNA polymerase subunit alpha [Candidatus Gottesmanbacteria bacterium]|nr:DNA-directed RNA polymerase subunit alpha [Candidatus Gottesmanbacteria bacterium]